MRDLRVWVVIAGIAGAGFFLSGCSSTRTENGVIIEQRSWWNIFSEVEPAAEGEEGDLPS